MRIWGYTLGFAVAMILATVIPTRPQSGGTSPLGQTSLDPTQRQFVQDYVKLAQDHASADRRPPELDGAFADLSLK